MQTIDSAVEQMKQLCDFWESCSESELNRNISQLESIVPKGEVEQIKRDMFLEQAYFYRKAKFNY